MKNSFQQSRLQAERASIGTAAMMGTITQDQRDRLQEIDKNLSEMPDYGITGISKVPGLLVSFAAAQGLGATKAFSGPLANIPGMSAAMAIGAQPGLDAAAHMYLDLEKKGIDRQTALSLSLMNGTIQQALMLAPIGKMTGVSPALDWLKNMGANKILEAPTIRNAIARYGVDIAEQAGVFGTISGVGSLANSIVSDIGDLHKAGQLETMSPGAMLSTFFRDENMAKAKQAAEEGALTGGAISGISGAVGIPHDIQMAREAKLRAQTFAQIGETVKNSEVFQKLPAKTQEIVSRLTKDGPLENGFVPMESWNTYWQEKKVNPRDAAEAVNGDATEYDQAMQSGADLRIPMDKYAVTIAPTEHNEFFQNELRTSPNEMNAREADEFLKSEMGKAQEQATPGPAEEAAAGIKEDIQRQLKDAGYSAEAARNYAQVYESAFGAMGQRAGIDPLELYQRYGLNIQRAETIPTDEMAVRTRAESLAAKDQERFNFERSQFDQWRELLKSGVKPVTDAAEEYAQIPNWAKNKEGRGLDEYRAEAIEKGLLRPDEDIFQKLRSLEAPEKPRTAQSFGEEARQAIIEEKKQEKPGFFQNAIDKVKTLFQGEKPKTETPEFKKWFGESKVVDENGKPQVVYHGTTEEFNRFDKEKATMGGITWFTSNPETANEFATSNPKEGANVKPLYAAIKNPAGWDEYNKYGLGELKSLGYDGVILKEEGGAFNGFAFEPAQFKSASGNSGKFNINNSDIRYQGDRGFIQFGDQKINISLLKNADLSTFLHETGHLYLNIMGDLAKDGPEQIKSDCANFS